MGTNAAPGTPAKVYGPRVVRIKNGSYEVTLPKQVVKHLGLREGQKIAFVVKDGASRVEILSDIGNGLAFGASVGDV